MLPGPVFTFELMTTARRGRLYLVRAFYAVVLLVILWAVHSGVGIRHRRRAVLSASAVFRSISVLWNRDRPGGAVLALTPALVAGVIADEKQCKTLHYLMASQLTSSEIVLGKLLVRMLYMLVLWSR